MKNPIAPNMMTRNNPSGMGFLLFLGRRARCAAVGHELR
jgi:hypothetical protein